MSRGHCHPALVAAVSEQAAKLGHVSNYYYIEKRGEVAAMISDMINDGAPAAEGARPEVWKSFFANSGAEANECAIKLARLYARKRTVAGGGAVDAAPRLIVTLEKSFHGRTLATLAATAQPVKQESFQPLPAGFLATPQNDVAALERLFDERGGEICAVMVACIQGESGVHPCTSEFLGAARRLTAERGALLVCDEVQCGIYRTGRPFGFQQFGIMLGVTVGGSIFAGAAAQATVRELSADGFAAHVVETGAYLRERLASLRGIEEVRGYGLMVGADLACDAAAASAPDVVAAALDAGFVINATGPRTLRFLPPLICERNDVDRLVDALSEIVDAPSGRA